MAGRLSEQRIHKFRGVEQGDIGSTLACPDETNGNMELVTNREDDAALRGPIEFCEEDRRDAHGRGKRLCLGEPILSGRGVEHEQDFMGSSWVEFARCSTNLGELLHKIE